MRIALVCGGVSSGGLYLILSEIFSYYPPCKGLEITLFCSSSYIKPYHDINPLIKIQLCNELNESKIASLLNNHYPKVFLDKIEKYDPFAIFFISGASKKGLENYNTFIVLHNQLYVDYLKILKQLDFKVAITTLINAFHFNNNVKNIKHIIYSSEFSKIGAKAMYPDIPSTVIPLTINSKFLADIPQDVKSFNRDNIQLLNIGSVLPYKNQSVIVKALRLLIEEGYNVHCTFIGRVISKPYYLYINWLIKKYSLDHYVTFIPWLDSDKVPHAIDSCDIYINSSETDTCGTSIEEGMARKKAVIASDMQFNREKVGNAGLYYDLSDPTSLADAIKDYINNSELREKKSIEGFEKTTHWSLLNTAKGYYNYIIFGDNVQK